MTAPKSMNQRLDEIMAEVEKEADLDGLATFRAMDISAKIGLEPRIVQRYLAHMGKQGYFESYVASSKTGYVIQLKGFE